MLLLRFGAQSAGFLGLGRRLLLAYRYDAMQLAYNVVYAVKSFEHLLMMTLDLQSSSFPQLLGKHVIDPGLLADDLVIEFLFVDLQEIAINLIFFDVPPHRVFMGY